MPRKLRMGLVGGGGQGFIGRVHATAATLDNRAELVAGAFSSNPDKSRGAADAFGVPADRAYGSYQELLQAERELPADQRVDFISVATPNHTHFEIAAAALQAGFHVVCDKPMTVKLEQARELAELVAKSGAVFVLTHNYSGYPLVRQAREMIKAGELGPIQAVRTHYVQGGLRGLQAGAVPERGAWKLDPEKAGSGALGDIGTHAYQLTRFVTGLQPRELSCQLRNYHPARSLDDYGSVTIRCADDALANVVFSQVTHGRMNDLTIEVDGENGSVSWRQEEPNQLVVRRFNKPTQIYERHSKAPYLSEAGRAACRLPGGHPEAFFEAFANVYCSGFDDMLAEPSARRVVYPSVDDGVEGVAFVEQCLASDRANGGWVRCRAN